MASIKQFASVEEFQENNKLLRSSVEKLNTVLAGARQDELDLILNLYLSYLKTPKEYIDAAVEKYGINTRIRKSGAVFLLVVLESKKFRSKYQKWDARKYGEWAKILTYFIEKKKTFAQAKKIIEDPTTSKYKLLTESGSGIVNETNYKKTMKQFREVHKAQYGQGSYLIFIADNGELTHLPKDAIDLLDANGYFDKNIDVQSDMDYTDYNASVPLTIN